jgi:methionyl-tRNA synthetase
VSALANRYIDQAAPWAAAKSGDNARVDTVLTTLLSALRALGVMAWPAMPNKAQALLAQLGLPGVEPRVGDDLWAQACRLDPLPPGVPLGTPSPLFPTYDADGIKAMLAKLVPKKEGDTALMAGPQVQPSAGQTAQGPTSQGPTGRTESPQQSPTSPPPATQAFVSYDDFARIDLRVGVVRSAERVPKKDKLLLLSVDIGEESPRTIVAGLALTFTPESLIGKRVVVVANLAPREFGKGLVSFGMLLATGPSDALRLATAPDDAPPGARLK